MFLKRTASVFVTQIITLILMLVTSVILARALGPAGKGQVALLSTIGMIVSLIGNLGIGAAATYYLNRAKEARAMIASNALSIQLGLTFLVLAIIIGLAPWLVSHVLKEQVTLPLLLLGLFLVPLTTLSGVLNGLLVGLGEIGKYNYSNITLRGTQLVFIIILLSLTLLSVAGAIIITGLSSACAAALGFYWLRQSGLHLRPHVSKSWIRAFLSYGTKAWVGNILQYFNYRLDTFIVNYFIGAAGLGQYSLAVTMAEFVWYIPNAVSTVLFPKTAADWDTATRFTPIASRNTALIMTLGAIGLGIVSFPFIRTVYGEEFVPSVMPLLALLPGIIFLGVGKVLASDLAGRGKPHYGTFSASAGLILTIIFDFLLIPTIGITGAGIASSLSYGLSSMVLLYLYVRLSGNTVSSVLLIQSSDLQRYLGIWKKYAASLGNLARLQ